MIFNNHETVDHPALLESPQELLNTNALIDKGDPVYKELFQRADKDGVAGVSRDELTVEFNNIYQDALKKSEFERVKEVFVAIDGKLGNNDGRLDKDELTRFKDLVRQEWKSEIDEGSAPEQLIAGHRYVVLKNRLGIDLRDASLLNNGISLDELYAQKEKGAHSMAEDAAKTIFSLAGKSDEAGQLGLVDLETGMQKFLAKATIDPTMVEAASASAYQSRLNEWLENSNKELTAKQNADNPEWQAQEKKKQDFIEAYASDLSEIVHKMDGGFASYRVGQTIQMAYETGGISLVKDLFRELDRKAKAWGGTISLSRFYDENGDGHPKIARVILSNGKGGGAYDFPLK